MASEAYVESANDRFDGKIKKVDDCQIWTGSRTTSGYGLFWFDGNCVLAHRYGYQRYVRDIPRGMHLMHSCENRLCVNPDHVALRKTKEQFMSLHSEPVV